MFEHLKKHVVSQQYHEHITWKPPTWVSLTGQPPPELKLERISDTSIRFARAQLNPRLPQVKQRKDGTVKEKDLLVRRERAILVAILSCVAGWDFVNDEKGTPVPLGKISGEVTDPGVRQVRELLRALGPDAEVSFVATCGDSDYWLVEEPDPDDKEDEVPLH